MKLNFISTLKEKGYAFEFDHETGITKVIHHGNVDLGSLTSLPDGIQFNNQDNVYLKKNLTNNKQTK